MILAAGRGERLRPLTDKCPKPLLTAYPDGTSFIERHLMQLNGAGFTDVVVNVSYLRKQIIQRLGDGSHYGVRIVYSDEGDTLLNTGGGIKHALRLLGDEPFLVINADVYTDWIPRVKEPEAKQLAHLLLAPPPGESGDFSLHNGLVTQGKQWTFCGIGYYRPELFYKESQANFPLLSVLTPAIAKGTVGGEVYNGLWLDIGTPETLELARHHASLQGRTGV